MIPQIKNENDLKFIYGYDITLDASLSNDEQNMRSIQSFKPDPQLLFSWECPLILNIICQQFNEFSIDNKKLILKFKDYQAVMQTPAKEIINLEFLLKLKKNNRYNSKHFSISIQKPKETNINKNENNNNNSAKNQTIIIENLEEILYIDYRLSKNEDIFFEMKCLDDSINFSFISLYWNIQHFNDNELYLNGQNEKILRIKITDLLIGINEIICEITYKITNQKFKKIFNYNVDRNPYGGNCLVSPNSGISLYTNFTFIQEGWKGGAMPLLFKIKYKSKTNILLDISNGGFFSQNFTINYLPEVDNNLFLDVSDQQGRSVLYPCLVKVKNNNNKQSIGNYLAKTNDIFQKMLIMDFYNSNNNEDKENKGNENTEINNRLDILNTYIDKINDNFNSEKFLQNYDKIVSFLLELSNKNLKDINFRNLYDVLDLMIKNCDPFLDDLNKINFLYRILDNFSMNIQIKIVNIKGIYIKLK